MKLLVVEDHESLGDMIAAHMREHGFAVDRLRFGADAFAAIAATRYDAMILDLGLPDIDGMDVLRRLRNTAAPLLPILILTARDRVDQRIAGLDAGADDYVLKPFDIAELEARLRAVLRRPAIRGGPLLFGDVSFDAANCAARVGTQNLELARREAALLEALIRNGEQIVIRDTLIERLYGIETDVSGNAIEATVSRLRRKLHALGSNVHIEVVRGIGYRLRQRASGA
jgi:two-component system response regulator QseB